MKATKQTTGVNIIREHPDDVRATNERLLGQSSAAGRLIQDGGGRKVHVIEKSELSTAAPSRS